MSRRELVVLGTASQVPTRSRSHNAYVLFWDEDAILFDPGEGAQRQMTLAGVSASDLTRVAITHLHGDHSIGLAGVVQRISLDRVERPVPVSFPESGRRFVENLTDASAFFHGERLALQGITAPGPIARVEGEKRSTATLKAVRLDHAIDTYGYRLDEPDGVRLDKARLAATGLRGPDVGRLLREGRVGDVRLEDVQVAQPGQSFAFVMDTRLCDGVHELADGADMLVSEATFLDRDRQLAEEYGHLTALQAARVAAEAGVRSLVLTHFSQRYRDMEEFEAEARTVYAGELLVAADLDRVAVPRRRQGQPRPTFSLS